MQKRHRKVFILIAFVLCAPFSVAYAVGQVHPLESEKLSSPCSARNSNLPEPPVSLSSANLMKRVLQKAPIERPGSLGRTQLRGVVHIEIIVDESGHVTCSYGLSGHPIALGAAVRSVSQWLFRPYMRNGKPKAVSSVLVIRYNFGP